MNESAEDLLNEAIDHSNKNEYNEARSKYNGASKKFLKKTDLKVKYVFRCIANKYRDSLSLEEKKGIKVMLPEGLEDKPMDQIITEMKDDIEYAEKKIFGNDRFYNIGAKFRAFFQIDEKKLWIKSIYQNIRSFYEDLCKKRSSNISILTQYSVIIYLTTILKELELYFFEKGYEDQSDIIHALYMQRKIQGLRYQRKYLKHRPKYSKIRYFCKIIHLYIHQFFLSLFGVCSKFGIGVKRLIYSTIFVTIVFGFLFKFRNCIWDNSAKNTADWRGSFYYSFVNLINVGSEIYYPLEPEAKIYECIESIIGFIFLGMAIALITRKVR